MTGFDWTILAVLAAKWFYYSDITQAYLKGFNS